MQTMAGHEKKDRSEYYLRVCAGFCWIGISYSLVWGLRVARGFLIPLITAFLFFYLATIIDQMWGKIQLGRFRIPRQVRTALSFGLILVILIFIVRTIADNAFLILEAAPRYQARLEQLHGEVLARFGFEEPESLQYLFGEINLRILIQTLISGMAGFMGFSGLIIIYVVFILMERSFFLMKLSGAFPEAHRRDSVINVINEIDHDVRTYLGVKTFVSVLTGTLSYLILRYVGLDFAQFWAILIFMLNYIPNVGSMIATMIPTLLALVQFDSLRPFLIIGIGVTAIQVAIGSFLEPNLMGRSLNISPLVVVLSLVIWTKIWGIPGAFLCVPLTSVFLIILSHFEATRWISLCLTRDGRLKNLRSS